MDGRGVMVLQCHLRVRAGGGETSIALLPDAGVSTLPRSRRLKAFALDGGRMNRLGDISWNTSNFFVVL